MPRMAGGDRPSIFEQLVSMFVKVFVLFMSRVLLSGRKFRDLQAVPEDRV
jgi:hypothetical protein